MFSFPFLRIFNGYHFLLNKEIRVAKRKMNVTLQKYMTSLESITPLLIEA